MLIIQCNPLTVNTLKGKFLLKANTFSQSYFILPRIFVMVKVNLCLKSTHFFIPKFDFIPTPL